MAAAAKWLHTIANNIDDPAMRDSFLTRIPEHRRIQDLAQKFEVRGIDPKGEAACGVDGTKVRG